jgi:hypothetical protein
MSFQSALKNRTQHNVDLVRWINEGHMYTRVSSYSLVHELDIH